MTTFSNGESGLSVRTKINAAITTVDGLGTISTQNSNAVAITGGTIAGIADLAVADGGTGASTAATARTNLGAQETITGAATTIATADLTASRALTSNASGKVAVSAVTATELGYVSGVTSAIQTQITAKQATITGAATTITGSDLTASRAVISNASGKVDVSAVTSTELGYVSGVTSAIQTQLGAKAPLASPAFTGNTTATGTVSDQAGDLRDLVNSSKTAAYVPVVTDNGKLINITTGGVTINSGIFTAGENVTIYNNSASSQTITQGTSVTMYLAGSATTGNRTLAQRGIATILCVASNTFVCSGAGVT